MQCKSATVPFLLSIAALGLMILSGGIAVAADEASGRWFDVGDNTRVVITASSKAKLSPYQKNLEKILVAAVKKRLASRDLKIGGESSGTPAEAAESAKKDKRTIFLNFSMDDKAVLSLTMTTRLGSDAPALAAFSPQPVSLTGSYRDAQGFEDGAPAEIAPFVDFLLDDAFDKIAKDGLTP